MVWNALFPCLLLSWMLAIIALNRYLDDHAGFKATQNRNNSLGPSFRVDYGVAFLNASHCLLTDGLVY